MNSISSKLQILIQRYNEKSNYYNKELDFFEAEKSNRLKYIQRRKNQIKEERRLAEIQLQDHAKRADELSENLQKEINESQEKISKEHDEITKKLNERYGSTNEINELKKTIADVFSKKVERYSYNDFSGNTRPQTAEIKRRLALITDLRAQIKFEQETLNNEITKLNELSQDLNNQQNQIDLNSQMIENLKKELIQIENNFKDQLNQKIQNIHKKEKSLDNLNQDIANLLKLFLLKESVAVLELKVLISLILVPFNGERELKAQVNTFIKKNNFLKDSWNKINAYLKPHHLYKRSFLNDLSINLPNNSNSFDSKKN